MKCMLFSAKAYEQDLLNSMRMKQIEFCYCNASLDLQTSELIEKTEAISIFVNDKVDAVMAGRLKEKGVTLLITRSTGIDHIDIEACSKMGIQVENITDYGSSSIAEHALMLTLCLLRNYKQSLENMENGDFRLDKLISDNLHGKTVAVVGTGRIGSLFAKHMKNMGAQVLGYDSNPDPSLVDSKTLEYVDLDKIFLKSDIISLHLPLTPKTCYFFSADTLSKLKKSPWIINTARGGLVDTSAMIQALENHQVKGYAADVYEHESNLFFKKHTSAPLPDSQFNKLFDLPNVIITPHCAFAERESIKCMLKKMVNKLEKWSESKSFSCVTI